MPCDKIRNIFILAIIAYGLTWHQPVAAAKNQETAVKQLTARYNTEEKFLQVRWKHTEAASYIVQLKSGSNLVAEKVTTKKHVKFNEAVLIAGTTYTVRIRVNATTTTTASHWKKKPYTQAIIATSCPTQGMQHSIYATTSTNPDSFPDSPTPITELASVPDGLRLTQTTTAGMAGDILVYFARSGLCMVRSTDNGATWSNPLAVVMTGNTTIGGPVDPSLVQLDNGQLRLYYFGSETTSGDPAQVPGDHVIYSALSDDGIHFTVENGQRFALESITDPEVLQLGSTWIMYLSQGSISLIATSIDGLNFTKANQTWNDGGIPGAYVDTKNLVHIYGCAGSIQTATSTDGLNFSATITPVLPVNNNSITCDPSPILLPDNSVLMIYKKQTN